MWNITANPKLQKNLTEKWTSLTYRESDLSFALHENKQRLHGCPVNHLCIPTYKRGGADKSLSRSGRKQATVTNLGIYSTYSPRSSIHFLVRCFNFCKPLKKKIQKSVRPTRSPRQQRPPRRTKNGDLSIVVVVYFRTVQRTHTNKEPLIYAATSPHTDVF
jgi:hypothetical protein